MKRTIKQGEDLWFLAEYYYGDAALWDIIYYYNKEKIGDDPEDLPPGITITIPSLPTGDQVLSATEMATQ